MSTVVCASDVTGVNVFMISCVKTRIRLRHALDSRADSSPERFSIEYRRSDSPAMRISATDTAILLHAGLQVVGPFLTKVAVDRYLTESAAQRLTFLDAYLSPDTFRGAGPLMPCNRFMAGLNTAEVMVSRNNADGSDPAL